MGRANWVLDNSDFQAMVDGDEEILVCITRKQAAIVSSWAMRLAWPSTWEGRDMPFRDVEEAQVNLMGLSLSDIVARLDLIVQMLGELGAGGGSGSGSGCCGRSSGTAKLSYSPHDHPVPQNVIDSGWATDSGDYAGMSDYLCASADAIVDSMLNKVDQLQDIWEGGFSSIGVLLDLLSYIFIGGIAVPILTLWEDAYGLASELEAIVSGDVFDELRDEIEGVRNFTQCVMKLGMASDNLADAIKNRLKESSPIVGLLASYIGWNPVIEAIYQGVDGEGNDITGYLGDPRNCSASCEDSAIFNLDGEIVGSGWVSGSGVLSGQVIDHRVKSAVIGIEQGWRMRGWFDDPDVYATFRISVLENPFEGGGGDGIGMYVNSIGEAVDISVDELNGGVTIVAKSFNVPSWRSFTESPPRPRVKIEILDIVSF